MMGRGINGKGAEVEKEELVAVVAVVVEETGGVGMRATEEIVLRGKMLRGWMIVMSTRDAILAI